MVTPCKGVPHTFRDASTRILHNCSYVCLLKTPLDSPPDCQELCPELYECLVEHYRSRPRSPPTSTTPPTPLAPVLLTENSYHGNTTFDEQTKDDLNLALLLGGLAVAMAMTVFLITLVVLCRRYTKYRHGRPHIEHTADEELHEVIPLQPLTQRDSDHRERDSDQRERDSDHRERDSDHRERGSGQSVTRTIGEQDILLPLTQLQTQRLSIPESDHRHRISESGPSVARTTLTAQGLPESSSLTGPQHQTIQSLPVQVSDYGLHSGEIHISPSPSAIRNPDNSGEIYVSDHYQLYSFLVIRSLLPSVSTHTQTSRSLSSSLQEIQYMYPYHESSLSHATAWEDDHMTPLSSGRLLSRDRFGADVDTHEDDQDTQPKLRL